MILPFATRRFGYGKRIDEAGQGSSKTEEGRQGETRQDRRAKVEPLRAGKPKKDK
jgi:hypothetical protein